ncbi:hypothetical protein AB0G71_25650 [Streptomyces sp. NPDC020403]
MPLKRGLVVIEQNTQQSLVSRQDPGGRRLLSRDYAIPGRGVG